VFGDGAGEEPEQVRGEGVGEAYPAFGRYAEACDAGYVGGVGYGDGVGCVGCFGVGGCFLVGSVGGGCDLRFEVEGVGCVIAGAGEEYGYAAPCEAGVVSAFAGGGYCRDGEG